MSLLQTLSICELIELHPNKTTYLIPDAQNLGFYYRLVGNTALVYNVRQIYRSSKGLEVNS
jgi:hypothetical protein